MGIRPEILGGGCWPAVTRTVGAGGAFAFVLFVAAALSQPANAQQALLGSELAGVTFPQSSIVWIPDAARSQAAALDVASALVDRACGPTEFHLWDAVGASRDTIRTSSDTAFAEAGWLLGVINLAPDGERIYLAARGEEELVMVWMPQSEAIGLVICVVAGQRTAGLEPGDVADPVGQLTPLPRPRPDPNAPRIAQIEPQPIPQIEPEAVELSPLPDAEIAEQQPDADADADGRIGGIIAQVQPQPDGEPAEIPAAPGSSFSIWLLLLAVAFAVASYFLLRWGRLSAKAIAGASWTATLATVVYSDVASEKRRDRLGKEITRYVPVVAYAYEVDGEPYQAARMRFGDASSADISEARKLAERFPIGAGIEIRYDPKSPSEATIEADPDRVELRMIGGISLAVLAIAALLNSLG